MKKLILFISIFAITLSGKGQDTNALFESISNPNAKITETVKLIDEYLNRPLDGEPLDTEGVEKHLINWKKFWIASVGSDYTPFSGLQSLNSALSGSYSCNSEPTWQSRGPIVNPKYSNGTSISGGLMGRVSAIAATASNQTIYAGVSFSGLFKSTNGGSTWANVTDGLNRIGLAVRTIAIDPNNNNTVLCGTGILAYSMGNYTNGYSQQIIRSTDAGNTWQQITLKTLTNQVEGYGYVNSIVFDVNNIGRVYASVDEEIYLSTDHGASWFKLLIPGAFSTRRISDMVIDPSTGHLWVGVDDKDFNQGGAGLYEIEPNYVANTSGGYSWTGIITQRTPLQVIGKYNLCSVEYSPSTLNKIYTIYDIGDTTTIVQQPTNSSIASRIYTHITTNFTFEKLEFEVSPSNADVMYFGGIWLQVSIDGGNNLTNTNSSTHDDIRALEILQAQNTSNGNTDVVLVGHDGGISITHDGFGTNSILNGVGLNIMEIWNASALGNNGEYIIGAHDNGTLKFHPEYNEWRQRRGNDGGAVTKDDINNPYIVYGGGNSGTQGYVHLSTDRGNNFTRTGLKLGGWGEDSFIKSYTENRIFFPDKGKDTLMSHSFSSSHTQLVFNTRNTIRRWGDIVDFELSKDVNYPGLGFLAVSWPENSNLDSSSIVCLELDPSNNYSLNNWYDITAGLLADQKAAITDIEIDHGNVIYVSFGNFYEIGGQAQKVYKGLWDEFSKSMSWTNVSYNLPNVPFRALKIPRGSNYIYAASDAGIYYKKLTDTQWSCFGTGLPKTVIHSLSVDECKNELIASTFGRGVWTAPLLDVVEAENEYAYRFQTINTNTEITKNIIVGSNVILYITGTPANPIELNFASNTSIIIESGGEVEISYATLTNRCDAMWPGIIVKGDPSVNQIQYRNRQGRLTMLNSTVENSRYGVTVASNPKNLDQNIGTGGIISLSNVLFKNNFRSIQFGAYDYNYHNGKIFQNMSSIVNCDFVIDDDYRLYNSNKALIAANSPEIQPVHISYNKVRNVNTSNNTFTTQLLPTSSIPKANLGIGVYSVDSDVDIRNCSFIKLNKGMEISQIKFLSGSKIHANSFDECVTGVYMVKNDGPFIYQNDFNNMGESGIFMKECSAFEITENNFTGGNKVGTCINSSNFNAELVYKNNYANLNKGIQSESQISFNTSINNTMEYLGLSFNCNSFAAPITTGDFVNASGAVRYYQGVCRDQFSPLGNEFSHTCGTAVDIYMNRQLIGGIKYSHFDNPGTNPYIPSCNSAPIAGQVLSVAQCNYQFDPQYNCESKVPIIQSSDPGELGGNILVGIIGTDRWYSGGKDELNELKDKIDGGQTSTVLAVVDDAINNTYDIAPLLESYAPYLSDEVLLACINAQPSFNNADLFDLLILNSPLPPAIQFELTSLSNQLTPQQMTALENAQVGPCIRYEEEQNINALYSESNLALNNLLHVFLYDTLVPDPNDSLKKYLTQWNSPSAKSMLIKVLWKEESYAEAQLQIDTLLEDSNYAVLAANLQWIQGLYSENQLLSENLDSILLDSIGSDTTVNGFALAQSILTSVGYRNYQPVPELVEVEMESNQGSNQSNASAKPNAFSELNSEANNLMTFPNPVNDLLTLTWNFAEDKNRTFRIVDIYGKMHITGFISNATGQQYVKTQELSTGTYLFMFEENGVVVRTEKLIVND